MYFFPSNFKYFLRKKHFLAMAGFARPGMLGKRVLRVKSIKSKIDRTVSPIYSGP